MESGKAGSSEGKAKGKAVAKGGSKTAVRGGVAKRGGRGGRGAGRGSSAAGADGVEHHEPDTASLNCKGWFSKDLRVMLYGYGDSSCPLDETVDLVEDIVVDYMKETTVRAAELANETLKSKIDEKDLLFLVRKEPAKFGRVKDLLMMNQVIKEVRNSVYKDDESAAAAAEE